MTSKMLDPRLSWNFVNAHANRRKGDLAAAIVSGWEVVQPDVLALISHARPKSIVHIMCNDGREAVYLSRTLRVSVTGIDFSAEAIRFAKKLNNELATTCNFKAADAIKWAVSARSRFDVVFFSLGSLWWIADLAELFTAIRRLLTRRGRVIIFDFHPLTHCLDEDVNLAFDYPFVRRATTHVSGVLDYTADPESYVMPRRTGEALGAQENPFPIVDYKWSLESIFTVAIASGGRIATFKEWPFVWGERYFAKLERTGDMEFSTGNLPKIPLTMAVSIEFE